MRDRSRKETFPVRLFGDEDFDGEVERCARRGDHQGCSALGIAEDEQFGRPHFETRRDGLAGMIDEAEELDAFFIQEGLEPLDGLFDGMATDGEF